MNTRQHFERVITQFSKPKTFVRPVIYDIKKRTHLNRVSKLLSSHTIQHVTDDYVEQLREYFQVLHPDKVYSPQFETLFQNYLDSLRKSTPLSQHGRWVFYPWISTLVHILEEKAFFQVRTARNKNLINIKEQESYYHAVVGIAGLSVGNSVALAIVLQGGARHIKLADFDVLALSNTNRIRTGVENLGLNKAVMTARQIYLINPYAKVDLFTDGLNKKNVSKFFKRPKLDIVIDEIDNLAVKYLIREWAKKMRLAVVMAADNGDNGVVDIERYDKYPKTKFFHGRMGRVTYTHLANLDKFGIGKMITKHVGPENVTIRMQESLREMGKTIVSWPQLGGAALLNGSAVAYCVRKILNNQAVESTRALISLDEKLSPRYNSKRMVDKRKKAAKEFKKVFGL